MNTNKNLYPRLHLLNRYSIMNLCDLSCYRFRELCLQWCDALYVRACLCEQISFLRKYAFERRNAFACYLSAGKKRFHNAVRFVSVK